MTPVQKADQLYSIFWHLAMDHVKSRDAAILCVKEIIKAVADFDNELYEHEGVRMHGHKEYYEDVLFELKNNQHV